MITAEDFEKLREGRNYIWVRMFQGGSQVHHGGGMLLGIQGKKGVVKPAQRHRKLEYIPLDQMTFWKSRTLSEVRH